jgi:aryl-alcohol dehydrogenase-like predicted oxidoreductase
MKIGLGSAQFGLKYGISNQTGQTPAQAVKEILLFAQQNKIKFIDTAFQYGEAEAVLGSSLAPDAKFNIITKCPPLGTEGAGKIKKAFEESLRRMQRQNIYGLMVHHAADLMGPDAERLWDLLQEFKSAKLVAKIGVSFYEAAQIDVILKKFPVELVQLPLNIFDQRLLRSGHLKHFKKLGIEIHSRSAFLQGLLLMKPSEIPVNLGSAAGPVEKFQQAAEAKGFSPMQAALQFVNGLPEIDSVICGVNSLDQLKEICAAAALPQAAFDFASFALEDEKIINPSLWPKKSG